MEEDEEVVLKVRYYVHNQKKNLPSYSQFLNLFQNSGLYTCLVEAGFQDFEIIEKPESQCSPTVRLVKILLKSLTMYFKSYFWFYFNSLHQKASKSQKRSPQLKFSWYYLVISPI